MTQNQTNEAGTYACFNLDKEAANNLYEFVTGIMPEGTELQSVDSYHITTIYSRKQVDHTPAEAEGIAVTPIGYEYLGRPGDDCVIALRVEHPRLYEQHTAALSLGATHDFDEYLPHITLTKKIPGRTIDIEQLPLPHWVIHLTNETVSTLREHIEEI